MEYDVVKLQWDIYIRTNRVIEAKHPGIVLIDKKNKETLIIDVAEIEKITKYQDLVIDLNILCDTNNNVIHIVNCVVGAENQLIDYLALLGVQTREAEGMQPTAFLGSAHILRKVRFIPA